MSRLRCSSLRLLTAVLAARTVLSLSSAAPALVAPGAPPQARLADDLDRLQRPGRCDPSTGRFLVFEYDFEDDINGFAAVFQFLAAALGMALATNRTLVESVPAYGGGGGGGGAGTHDTWLRAPESVCGGLKHGCYFDHLSSCVYAGGVGGLPTLDGSLRPQADPVVRIHTLATYKPVLHGVTGGEYAPQYWREDASWCVGWGGLAPSAPDCWRVLWFPSLQAWLYTPRGGIRKAVVDAAGSRAVAEGGGLAFDVGIHVRRGDALTLNWRSHAGINEYTAAVGKAVGALDEAGRGGPPKRGRRLTAFIATDSFPFKAQLVSRLAGTAGGIDGVASPALILQAVETLADGSKAAGGEATAHIESVIKRQASREWAERAVARPGAVLATQHGGTTDDEVVYVGGQPVLRLGGAREGRRALPPPGITALAAWCASLPDPALCDDPTPAPGAEAPVADAYVLTAGVVGDIWALSHSRVLVGTCLSQVSRTALDLQYAHNRAEAPGLALDKILCDTFPHDFAMLTPWQAVGHGVV